MGPTLQKAASEGHRDSRCEGLVFPFVRRVSVSADAMYNFRETNFGDNDRRMCSSSRSLIFFGTCSSVSPSLLVFKSRLTE